MNKFYKTATSWALIASILASNLISLRVFALSEDKTVRNGISITTDDNVTVSKIAVPTSDTINSWDITLDIQAKKIEEPSDTIIVFDHSSSMKGNKLTKAKEAATTLAKNLLSDNKNNRVALVGFSTSAKIIGDGFTSDVDVITKNIDTIKATNTTNIQDGLVKAGKLLEQSNKDRKNIVLLSDGLPNTSNSDEYCGDYWDVDFPWGNPYQECESRNASKASSLTKTEATKLKKIAKIYTVVLGDKKVVSLMTNVASDPSMSYYADNENQLNTFFNTIRDTISNTIETQPASFVTDPMATGVDFVDFISCDKKQPSYDKKTKTITWYPEYTLANNTYHAQCTYRITTNNDILQGNSDDGFYFANGTTTLHYNGNKSVDFNIPKIKPTVVRIKKTLAGQICNDVCTFDIQIKNDTTYNKVVSLKANEITTLVESMPVGNYTITEVATNQANPVTLDNYSISYAKFDSSTNNYVDLQNGNFELAQGQDLDLIVANDLGTIDLAVSKTWNDDNDRDGVRTKNQYYIVLSADGNAIDAQPIAPKDQIYTFTNLPQYSDYKNKTKYQYTIAECQKDPDNKFICEDDELYDSEISVTDSNSFLITNTHVPEKLSITIKKNWDDQDDRDGLRIIAKNATRFCIDGSDGSHQCQTLPLDGLSLGHQEITFSDLPKYYDGGKAIDYQVTEETLTPTYSAKQITHAEYVEFTNSHDPEKTQVIATTKWEDQQDRDGLRGDYMDQLFVVLVANGTPIKYRMVSLTNEGQYLFDDLYKNEHGREIKYSIFEATDCKNDDAITCQLFVQDANYTASIDDLTIINSHDAADIPTPQAPKTGTHVEKDSIAGSTVLAATCNLLFCYLVYLACNRKDDA